MELTLKGFKEKINKARDNNQLVRYIRGPLPQNWISRACRLPGRTANMAIALWYRHGMEGIPVRVTTKLREEYGMSRRSAHRALELMEEAGLIKVDRQVGRAPRVIMLDVEEV